MPSNFRVKAIEANPTVIGSGVTEFSCNASFGSAATVQVSAEHLGSVDYACSG